MTLALVVSLMTILSGCTGYGSAPLSIQLPADCQQLAKTVPLPAIKKGDDIRSLLARHRAGLVKANANLDAVRNCEAKLIAQYGNVKL